MSNQIHANRQVVVFIKHPPGNYLVLKKNRPEKFPFCLFTETKTRQPRHPWPLNLTGWWFMIRGDHPRSHVTLWSIDHESHAAMENVMSPFPLSLLQTKITGWWIRIIRTLRSENEDGDLDVGAWKSVYYAYAESRKTL